MEKLGRMSLCIMVLFLGTVIGDVIVSGIDNITWSRVFITSVHQAVGVLIYGLLWEKR